MKREDFVLDGELHLKDHVHPGIHLVLVASGTLIERAAGAWRPCPPGTLRVSPPGARHELRTEADGARVEILEVPGHLARGLPGELSESRFFGTDRIQELRRRLESANSGHELESIVLEVVVRSTSLPDPEAPPPSWLFELRNELELMRGPASLRTVAGRVARHPSHVAKSFRRWFGRSIGAHVLSVRLHEAEQRLRESDQALVDIAGDLGFADQAHFSRAFRRHFHRTPSAYRRGLRQS